MSGLRVRVLGTFSIGDVPPAALGSRKARTLAKLLVLARGRPVSTGVIIDAAWGDAPPSRAADQVSVLVSRIRSAVGAQHLLREPAGYRLVVSWLDIDAMAELVEDAELRLRDGSPVAARTAARSALALAGPLLPDEQDAAWAEADRALAIRLEGRAHVVAARAALAAGEPVAAVDDAERALLHDPFDEVALRVLMSAHATAGRPGAALTVYERVKVHLAEELGIVPDAATEAIHDAIVLGRPLPAGSDGTDLGPRRSTLIGRDEVLLRLDAHLEATGPGLRLVVVEGDAGMGKTAVVDKWVARVPAGTAVLRGRCDELGRALPLQALLDAAATHLNGLGREAATETLGGDANLLAPLLGPAGLMISVPPAAGTFGAEGPAALFAALLRLVERSGGGRPAVIAIDDIHLADAALIEWLHFANRRLPAAATATARPAILIVATRRPNLGRVLPDITETIELGPLDFPAVAQLVGPDRAPELLARTGGNPMLLVELAATTPGHPLPASLVDSVDARVHLTGTSAPALRAAAVLGPEVDLDLLSTVLGAAPLAVLGDLEVGVAHGFLIDRDAAFAFRHALVREAIVERAPPARRALLHREAARALAARAESDPTVVAHHARLGGDTALAAEALGRAAALASARLDLGEAERLADDAIALDDTAALRLARSRIRLARRHLPDADADARVALANGAGSAALELVGWVAYYGRDFTAARAAADDGVGLSAGPEEQVGCLMLGGRVRHAAGDLSGAAPLLVSAFDRAQGSARAVAAVWLGSLRLHQGDAAAALDLVRPATLPGAGADHHAAVPHARLHTAHALAMLGRPAAALAALDDLDGEVARRELEAFAGRSDNFRAWILRNLGLRSEANDSNERGVEAGRAIGMAEPQAQGLVDLADGRLRDGDPEGCLTVLRSVEPLQVNDHGFRWRHLLRARLLSARAQLACGHAQTAHAGAAALVRDAEAMALDRYSTAGRLVAARAAAALGERVDRPSVERDVARLELVAGPEAWWMTAEMAATFSDDRWWAMAESRLETWTAQAGERRDAARRAGADVLDRLRS